MHRRALSGSETQPQAIFAALGNLCRHDKLHTQTRDGPDSKQHKGDKAHPLQKKMLGSWGPSRAYRFSTSSMVVNAARCLCLAWMASLTTNSLAALEVVVLAVSI